LNWKKKQKCPKLKGQNFKAPNYFEHYHNRYSDQAPPVADQYFFSCMLPLFRCRDLDLGLMTLKLNRDLDILKMYHHNENEVAR